MFRPIRQAKPATKNATLSLVVSLREDRTRSELTGDLVRQDDAAGRRSGHGRWIEGACPLDDRPGAVDDRGVGPDALSGPHQDHVAHDEIGRIDRLLQTVAGQAGSPFGSQVEEGADAVGRSFGRHRLEGA